MQLLQCLSLGLNYWLMQSLSWRWLYLELVYDLCGGDIAYYMMEYSYIVDITQEHDRCVGVIGLIMCFYFIHNLLYSIPPQDIPAVCGGGDGLR